VSAAGERLDAVVDVRHDVAALGARQSEAETRGDYRLMRVRRG
jgi:hypothetical protein